MISLTEFHELVKLPMLVNHFIEHRTENNQITFIEYLTLHYTNGDLRDADYDKDMKLPFKSHEDHTIVNFVPFFHSLTGVNIEIAFIMVEESFPAYGHRPMYSSYLSKIWQPPKSFS